MGDNAVTSNVVAPIGYGIGTGFNSELFGKGSGTYPGAPGTGINQQTGNFLGSMPSLSYSPSTGIQQGAANPNANMYGVTAQGLNVAAQGGFTAPMNLGQQAGISAANQAAFGGSAANAMSTPFNEVFGAFESPYAVPAAQQLTRMNFGGQNSQGQAINPANPYEIPAVLQNFMGQSGPGVNPNLTPMAPVRNLQSLLGGMPSAAAAGQQGIQETAGLGNQFENQLMSDIDRQAQLTIGGQLPGISASMEAAGLGQSGAARSELLQANNAVLEQANMQKVQALQQLASQSMGQQASAIGQATGLGGQEALAQQGQVANLYGQGIQDVNARYLAGNQNYLQALLGQGNLTLGENTAQANAMNQGIGQMGNLYNMYSGAQNNAMNQAMNLDTQAQNVQQQKLNQIMAAYQFPISTSLQLASGVRGTGIIPFVPGFGYTALQGAAGGVGQGIGQAVGQAVGPNTVPAGSNPYAGP